MADEGAHTVLTYNRDEAGAKETAERITADGHACSVHQLDVRDESSVRGLFRTVRERLSRLDVLVSNAGITRDGYLASMSVDKFDEVVTTNLRGGFLCCREALRIMAAQRRGSIVTVASIAAVSASKGREISPTQGNYSASKAGLVSLTRTLAVEAGRYGVRVNSVLPGFIETEMVRAAIAVNSREGLLGKIPLDRLGQPEDVARVVAFLASDRAAYITAESILVDGGRSAWLDR
jgi:3-oxoacyl-[acyl-carrier protein] reductase